MVSEVEGSGCSSGFGSALTVRRFPFPPCWNSSSFQPSTLCVNFGKIFLDDCLSHFPVAGTQHPIPTAERRKVYFGSWFQSVVGQLQG